MSPLNSYLHIQNGFHINQYTSLLKDPSVPSDQIHGGELIQLKFTFRDQFIRYAEGISTKPTKTMLINSNYNISHTDTLYLPILN